MTIPTVKVVHPNKNCDKYVLDYTVDGKRTRERVGKNKKDAYLIASKRQHELTLDPFGLLAKKKAIISFQSLIEKFLSYHSARNAHSTVNRYKNHLSPYCFFITDYFHEIASDIRLIKPEYIEECIEYLIKDIKPKPWEPYTINRSLQTLSSAFIFARNRDYLEKNPCTTVKKLNVPKKENPDYFNKEDLPDIWKALDPFWVSFFKFIYNTGLRKGELINLKWDRVYLDKSPAEIRVTYTEEWDPKTQSSVRNVPLNKTAKAIIEAQIGIDPGYVFVSKKGEKIHPNSPYEAIMRACEPLDIKGGVHKFRHTFASHLMMAGANIYELKELLGHTDIKQTQIYAHLSPKHQEGVVNYLDDDNEDS